MAQSADIAANIRAELARRQKNQGDLAKLLKTTRQTISRRLLGLTPFRVDEVRKIAEYFDIPVSELIGDGDTGQRVIRAVTGGREVRG